MLELSGLDLPQRAGTAHHHSCNGIDSPVNHVLVKPEPLYAKCQIATEHGTVHLNKPVLDGNYHAVHELHEKARSLPVEPVQIQAYFGRSAKVLDQHEEAQTGKQQYLQSPDNMGCRVWMVIDFVRQHVVKPIGIDSDKDTQERGNSHRYQHVARRLSRPCPAVLAKEGEIGQLQPGMQERPGGSQCEQQPYPGKMQIGCCRDLHGLAHESAEQGEGGNREAADHIQDESHGHIAVYAAQFAQLAAPGHLNDSACPHEEKSLVQNMGERM